MSMRLAKTFGSRPEVWLGLQMQYHPAQAEKTAHRSKVHRIRDTPPSNRLRRLQTLRH
jgi:plasmid maintenance system antidote protein VapI